MSMDDFFGEDGHLAKHLVGFKARPAQQELANKVMEAITTCQHLIAEAPTGSGKSLGSGIPAAIYALESAETVVIATANITLQEQLMGKDLPTIKRVLGECVGDADKDEFTFALMKGMSNYLCLAALDEVIEEKPDESWVRPIIGWSKETQTGDKSELLVELPVNQWAQVSTSSDDCMRKQCPRYNDCYVYKAREKAKNAHVIVTNYHMLFTDAIIRRDSENGVGLLPEYKVLIADESHEAADIAMDFQGFQLSASKLKWLVKALHKVPNSDECQRMIKRVAAGVDAFFKLLEPLVRQHIIDRPIGKDGDLVKILGEAANLMVRIGKGIDAEASPQSKRMRARLMSSAKVCRGRMTQIALFCFGDQWGQDADVEDTQQMLELAEKNTALEKQDGVQRLKPDVKPPKLPEGHVYYLERNQDRLELCLKVVNAQDFLRDNFFEPLRSVILTSATLSTDGSFDFIAEEVGLMEGDYQELIVPSPFDAERVLAIIPKPPFPEPNSSQFSAAVTDAIYQLCQQIEGGVMGLFTSYANLQAVQQAMEARRLDRRIYVQGAMPKSRIIESFKRDHEEGRKSLILATASFWQGVDIQGAALSAVVIDKIPFARPDDPVMYYLDKMREEGNAFFEYSLPKAIIALKQGVGRLIRTETDFGCVAILDVRLHTKPYRKKIIAALPAGCFITNDVADVGGFFEQFANGG